MRGTGEETSESCDRHWATLHGFGAFVGGFELRVHPLVAEEAGQSSVIPYPPMRLKTASRTGSAMAGVPDLVAGQAREDTQRNQAAQEVNIQFPLCTAKAPRCRDRLRDRSQPISVCEVAGTAFSSRAGRTLRTTPPRRFQPQHPRPGVLLAAITRRNRAPVARRFAGESLPACANRGST